MTAPPKPKFYTDAHVPSAVAKQLRRRDVAFGEDIVRCQEVGMADAKDPDHLAFAVEHGRILVTRDKGFAALHKRWLAEGRLSQLNQWKTRQRVLKLP